MELGIPGLGPAVRIGMGGSAIVYRARQDRLERDVAVKILTDRDPAFLRRFEREARMLGRLSRLPGIVTVHDSGLTDQGEPYLILEHCPTSLQDRLYADGPFDPAQACRLLARVADTVAQAADQGVVHRDLKPANILLDGEGDPMVTDFGIASVLGATNHSTSVGFTPGYAAPETLRGETGGAEVDVYAVGATLFHLVTGRAPFVDRVDGNNLVALAATIDAEPVEDLRPTGVPAGVCATIEWAMAKHPADRPTAMGLARVLDRLADDPTSDRAGERRLAEPGPGASRGRSAWPAPATGPGGQALDDRDPSPERFPAPVDRSLADARPAPPPTHLRTGHAPPAPASPGTGRRVGVVAIALMALLGGCTVFSAARSSDALPVANDQFAGAVPATTAPTTTFDPGQTPTTGLPTVPPTAALPTSPAEIEPTSLDELLGLWSDQRTEVVADLTGRLDGSVPVDGLVEGVGGFTIDQSACPVTWNDRAGITDDTITIGAVAPVTSLAAYGPQLDGFRAYLEWVNANGGIGPDGLRVEVRVLDDGGDPATTAAQVGRLLDDGAFALTTLSTPGSLAADEATNAACVPHAYVMNAHPAWGDPTGRPWTTGLTMSHATEAHLWAEVIDRRFTESVDVAALVMDNEFGRIYETSFRQAALGSRVIDDIVVVRHDPASVDVADEVAELAASGAGVVIAMTAGNPCVATVEAVADTALAAAELRLLPSVCQQPAAYLEPAGPAGDGWAVLTGGVERVDHLDPTHPFTVLIDEGLETAGVDSADEASVLGSALYGWAWHQTLEIAARLPGGLTRTNFVLAQRGLSSLDHPMLDDGVVLASWGLDDPYPIEGSTLAFAFGGAWFDENVIDIDGATPPCSWRDGTGC